MCPGHIFLPLVVTGIYCVPFLLGLGICSLPFSEFRSPWCKLEGMAKAGRGSDFLNKRCVRFSLFLEHLQVRNTIPPIKRKWIHVNRYFLRLGQLTGFLICLKFLGCVFILLSENSASCLAFHYSFWDSRYGRTWRLCPLSGHWDCLHPLPPHYHHAVWSLSCIASGTKTCQVLRDKVVIPTIDKDVGDLPWCMASRKSQGGKCLKAFGRCSKDNNIKLVRCHHFDGLS